MERVSSGIPGLDELIEGGFPKGSVILLSGTCGTGKTLSSLQFLWYGVQHGENGVYITFEEPVEQVKSNAKQFGWDFETAEKQGKIIMLRYDPFHVEEVIDIIVSSVRKINAKRLVIDSISALGMYIRDPTEVRRSIYLLVSNIYKLGCTTILTSEILPNQSELSRFGVEEFLADGVIVYYYMRVNTYFARALTIWKMRYTNHSQRIHPYKITEKGIVVFPHEESALSHRI
ncbi:MAG TPA: ATPase [Nanoarchaeota archaeon]|nr:ATPase [Nanoarchaeota archaeon]